MSKLRTAAWLTFACTLVLSAQTQPAGASAKMLVTVGHYFGHEPPLLTKNDVTIKQQFDPLPITSVIPLCGDRAGMELFLLVDNCSNCEPGTKFEELRRFITSQPATTAVGVAYIQDGVLKIAENPTLDRDRAVKALSAPTGGKPTNPFSAVTHLIKIWPQNTLRRTILMISNGVDPGAGDELQNPSADAAIATAERAGVTVFAIYHPSADYVTSDFGQVYSGQVQLAHLATESGGEAYFLGFGPLPSLAPFLADISDHLANQYFVEFLVSPAPPPGELQSVAVKSTIKDLDLMAPDKVWVPGREAEVSPKKKRP